MHNLFDEPLLSRTRFVIVTDGSQAITRGIGAFISTARIYLPKSFLNQLTILCPNTEFQKQLLKWFKDYVNEILVVTRNIPGNDKYAVKFMLLEYAKKNLSSKDILVYLDYDHIFFGPPQIEAPMKGNLILSSECHPSENIYRLGRQLPELALLKGIHYSNSLIIAYRDDFLMSTEQWIDIYHKIDVYIHKRFREEISFSAAVSSNGYRIQTAPTKQYGGWHLTRLPNIFHYGGVSNPASLLKTFLENGKFSAKKTGPLVPLICRIIQQGLKSINCADLLIHNA